MIKSIFFSSQPWISPAITGITSIFSLITIINPSRASFILNLKEGLYFLVLIQSGAVFQSSSFSSSPPPSVYQRKMCRQVPVDLLKCSFVHCSSPHSSVDTLTSRWICLKRRRHVYLYVSSFTSQSGWIVKMKIIPLHSQSRIFF